VSTQGAESAEGLETWAAVDDYFSGHLLQADPALEAALATSEAAGLPAHQVAPNQGKFLHLLARFGRARSVLEIGTLGGYSTIWLARALPADGTLVSLEADPERAELARANVRAAGLDHLVDVRVGPALDTLPGLAHEDRSLAPPRRQVRHAPARRGPVRQGGRAAQLRRPRGP
jgi:predicted O-methyltransferase YrrM